MKKDEAALVTDLSLETFRLNGELLAAGDNLVADIGLTSARWQVLGAIAMPNTPLTVAHTARNMGLSRQAVQRLANELVAEGLLEFRPNPHHARAKLLALTGKGKTAFEAAMKRWAPWAKNIGAGVTDADLKIALRVMRKVRGNLDVEKSRSKGGMS
jgi:DNA-binding MarR family transcriptional regulator